MKKKILKLNLVFILTLAVLFSLTACGSKEKDDEKDESEKVSSSAESVIENFVNAVNEHNASKIVEFVDIESFNKAKEKNLSKNQLQISIEEFFDEYKNFEINAKKITCLKNDKEFFEDLLDGYDSYEEFIKDSEEKYNLDNIDFYTAEVNVPNDFEDCFYKYKNSIRDIIIIRNVDGEYKIVDTAFFSIKDQKLLKKVYNSLVDNEKDETLEALQRAVVKLQGDFIDDYMLDGKNMTLFSCYFSSASKGKEALNEALKNEGYELVGNLTLGKGTPATAKGSIKKSSSTGATEYAFTITENINNRLAVTVDLD